MVYDPRWSWLAFEPGMVALSLNVETDPAARVTVCDVPQASVLDRHKVDTADFRDSYRAPLRDADADVVDLFHAVFAHHPMWMKSLLMARNGVMRRLGVEAPTAAEILQPNTEGPYVVGDTIGVWPIFVLTPTELIAGRDERHLDFRLSVLKSQDSAGPNVVISTICNAHNRFGRMYLRVIVPFHKLGVQHLIRQAMRTGRM
jgi:hypothetical protein